jgi:PilZ domain
MQQSRRRWRRKHSGAYCIVDLCNGTKPVQCRLINFSNGGACLYGFIDATTVPDRVRLFLRDRHILVRDCRTVWRDNRTIGVQFIAPPRKLMLSGGAHTTLFGQARTGLHPALEL